jgi:iron complex transport system substrate-binding protein
MAAGPPVATLLYTLAPEKLIGWVRAPGSVEKGYLTSNVRELPEYGRLTGRGDAVDFGNALKFKPDLIVDSGTVSPAYASLANKAQDQTGIAYILLDGRLDKAAEVYRLLGALLGAEDRAERLARYTEETLDSISRRVASIAERPRVYYARGADGLESRGAGSINTDMLERLGANNVAAATGTDSAGKITLEQIRSWNPGVILTSDAGFYRSVATDSQWGSVNAVQEKRIYLAPSLPFGWLDHPPGINRLIGVRWLASILYPAQFPENLRVITRDFYKLFYHIDLSEPQLDALLTPAPVAKRE